MPLKRKKGKNEPKQPDTAYICYWRSKRLELLSENPGMESVTVSKEVGQQWKALSEEERQVRGHASLALMPGPWNPPALALASVCTDA